MKWRTRPKYNNTKTEVDGWKFDSIAEANRYKELKLLQRSGDVLNIDIHPVFRLSPVTRYEADFTVYYRDGKIEVEDVKGVETEAFKIKEKMFNHMHPLAPLIKIKKGKKGRGSWKD